MDLIRTIQLGFPYNTSAKQIISYSKNKNTNFLGHILAKSALLSIGHEELLDSWPVSKLLDRLLNQIVQNSPSYSRLKDLPPGFNAEHTVFTVVYSMVMADQIDLATRILAEHSKTESHFKKSIVVQALSMIGSKKANGLIQRIIEKDTTNSYYFGDEVNGLLGFQRVPFLSSLKENSVLISPTKRSHDNLLSIVNKRKCDKKTELAIYMLGFFDNENKQQSINLLKELTESKCGVIHRYFAARSLALRSKETMTFWIDLIKQEEDAWLRAYLVKIAYIYYRKSFLDQGLDLLASELSQHVQWELMWSNIQLRRRDAWRSYWDIWLTPTEQFRITYNQKKSRLYSEDIRNLLSWLENGNHPKDSWVHTVMLRQIGVDVQGAYSQRYLDYYKEHEKEKSIFYSIQGFSDVRGLNRIQEWADIENDFQRKHILLNIVNNLKSKKEIEKEVPAEPCCDKTKLCLLATVRDLNEDKNDVKDLSKENKPKWLNSNNINIDDVRFINETNTHAEISFPNPPRTEHWKHAANCWILTKVVTGK